MSIEGGRFIGLGARVLAATAIIGGMAVEQARAGGGAGEEIDQNRGITPIGAFDPALYNRAANMGDEFTVETDCPQNMDPNFYSVDFFVPETVYKGPTRVYINKKISDGRIILVFTIKGVSDHESNGEADR